MGAAILLIFYGSLLFFAIASLIRLISYIRTPLHLRWELYDNLSSIYELPEWRTRASQLGITDKLKSIARDILLKKYHERNRGFWYFLFLFHLGLYLLILWHAWLFAAAVTIDVEEAPAWGLVWGHVATSLILVGSTGILIKRATERQLRAYYSPVHYLKWVFVMTTLAGGFYVVCFHSGSSMAAIVGHVKGQLAFDMEYKLHTPLPNALHMLFVLPWLIYLPFGHVMRLFLRYYHELRWDHVPNLRGSPMERRIEKLLGRAISWSAPHVQCGKTWAEVATRLPEDGPEVKWDESGEN